MPYTLPAAHLSAALAAAGYPAGSAYAVDLARLAPLAGVSTRLRWGHLLAQLAIESAGFRTTTEYASGAAYEGRRDLGNVQPGDGVRFRGRGLIQTTGRANYARVTRVLRVGFACVGADPDAPDFEAHPQMLARPPWCVLSALVYWTDRGLNAWADKGDSPHDVACISRAVNRGSARSTKPANHEAERTAAFRSIMKHLPR